MAEIVEGRKSGEVPNFISLKSETERRENLMSQIAKFLKVVGITCRESKKSQKVALHDFERKMESNTQLLSLTIF